MNYFKGTVPCIHFVMLEQTISFFLTECQNVTFHSSETNRVINCLHTRTTEGRRGGGIKQTIKEEIKRDSKTKDESKHEREGQCKCTLECFQCLLHPGNDNGVAHVQPSEFKQLFHSSTQNSLTLNSNSKGEINE